MDELYDDLNGEIYVRSPSNRIEGRFILYRQEESPLESELKVAIGRSSDIESTLEVKVQETSNLNTNINVMYGGTIDLESSVIATSVNSIDAELYIPPHNRILGSFELLAAPRVTVDLPPVSDATTRSRIDKQIINYGNTQSMLIGNSPEGEQFEAFIDFGDIASRIADINKIEEAKMRLYYSGSFQDGTDITLWQPSSIWREYGITYVNKPSAIELLQDNYSVNKAKYYIEIDILSIVKDWVNSNRINYGLIIQSNSDHATYFNTRESDRSPSLQIRYITTENYSLGRADVNSSINIIGVGHSDIVSSLNIKSNIGIEYLSSLLSVHRPEDILDKDIESSLYITRPDLYGHLDVMHAESTSIESTIAVVYSELEERQAKLTIAKPDFQGYLTVTEYTRANEYLDSILTVNVAKEFDLHSQIMVAKPDLLGYLAVRNVGLDGDLDVYLDVPTSNRLQSSIIISKPDLLGYITVSDYTVVREDLNSTITVTQKLYDDVPSSVAVSRPNLYGFLNVKYANDLESELYVKHHDYIGAIFDIRQKTDLSGQLIAKTGSIVNSEMTISRPVLFGYLYPRVVDETSVDSYALFRQLDVADMSATILIKGRGRGFYFYIM